MKQLLIGVVVGISLIGSAEAQKKPVKHTVTVSVIGSGTVISSTGGINCPSACTANVNAGTSITFTATPDIGATFSGWGGPCSGTSTTCSLTINDITSVSATFEGGGGGGVTIQELQARIEALEASLAGLEEVLSGVTRAVDTSTGKDTLYFDGVNVAIRSGSGATDGAVNGLGNLIIGYNESNLDTHTGSHNFVMGKSNSYTSYGAMVSGFNNSSQGPYASVIGGGENNNAVGWRSVILGGEANTTNGHTTVIAGGAGNSADARYSVIAGSDRGTTTGDFSRIFGGGYNTASGTGAVIFGGWRNRAVGRVDVIIGGDDVVCDDGGDATDESKVCGEGVLNPVD